MQDPSAGTQQDQNQEILVPPHTTTLVAMIDKRWRPIKVIVTLFYLKLKEIGEEHDELKNSNRAKRILTALRKEENQDVLQAILDDPKAQGKNSEEIDYTMGVIQRLEKMVSYSETPPMFGGEEAQVAWKERNNGLKSDSCKSALQAYMEQKGDNVTAKAWRELRQTNKSRNPAKTMYQIHKDGAVQQNCKKRKSKKSPKKMVNPS